MTHVDDLLYHLKEVKYRLEILSQENMIAADALDDLKPVIEYFETQKKAAEDFLKGRHDR